MQIPEIESSSTPDLNNAANKHKVRRRLAPSWVVRKRMHLDAVYCEDGHIIDDPTEAGEAFRRTWASVFSARPDDDAASSMDMFDESIVQDAEFGPWEWPRGELSAVAARLGRSAPGPDRVPCQVWGVDDPELDGVLDAIAANLAAGQPPPPWLNERFVVTLPKGEYHEDDARTARTPRQLRPITLVQCSAKLNAAAANQALSR